MRCLVHEPNWHQVPGKIRILRHPHPLTLYYFGQDEAEERLVLDQTVSGGVTVNDCMTHALAKSLPFGGIGHSGMGAYGGKAGFLTFSHARSIYRQGKSSKAELALRPPFTPPSKRLSPKPLNRGNFKDPHETDLTLAQVCVAPE